MGKVTDIESPNRRERKRATARVRSTSPAKRAEWENATKAYELRLGGKLPSEIAEILGIDVAQVYRLYQEKFSYDASYLTDMERKDILAMELARLDALQAAVWPAAMMGDPKCVAEARATIMARAKLVGLELADPVVQKNLVLVMGDKEEDYIAALKATNSD
jgi:hypothetical protein